MNFAKLSGLIPAVIQDDTSGDVLMVGFMNEEAMARTRESGFVTFFSRTRNTLWMKGETSGNRLQVTSMFVDCDEDTVLVKVKCLGDGNVCHTGTRTCFRVMA
jgi:phosphoribosyl-ATP pyrophosphohydrolase/phosphoribosyl-AMP cyclohydrolase